MEAQDRERQERERQERERNNPQDLSPDKSPKLSRRSGAIGKFTKGHTRNDSGSGMSNINSKGKGHLRNDSNGEGVGKGWKPSEEPIHVSKASDPILQQMEIIKGYIKQAKQAQRYDEVTMLEQNLNDLKSEFMRQKHAQSWYKFDDLKIIYSAN